MTVQHINTISQNIKYRSLLFNGVFLASRIVDDYSILLFQKGARYIEIVFDLNGDEIIKSRTFCDTDKLEPYLAQIKLPAIF